MRRSITVGAPRIRVPRPPGFGVSTFRTASGWYLPSRRASRTCDHRAHNWRPGLPHSRRPRMRPLVLNHAPIGIQHVLAADYLLYHHRCLPIGHPIARRVRLMPGFRVPRGAVATSRFRSGLSAFLFAPASVIEYSVPIQLVLFRPSPSVPKRLLWPRLTSAVSVNGRSPRVRRVTFVPSARRIYLRPVRVTIGLRVCLNPRPRVGALYAVRVPRAGTLPSASFRPQLAATPLLFG